MPEDEDLPEDLQERGRTLDQIDPVDGPDADQTGGTETSPADDAGGSSGVTGSSRTPETAAGEATDRRPMDATASRGERAAEAGKAITTDDTKKVTQYALPETWDDLRTYIDLEVQRELYERGIQGATDNEIFDAAMVVIQRYPEEVAEQVIERRLDRAD